MIFRFISINQRLGKREKRVCRGGNGPLYNDKHYRGERGTEMWQIRRISIAEQGMAAGNFFFFNFILLYNTVLVLPYIDMNPPRVYTSAQS